MVPLHRRCKAAQVTQLILINNILLLQWAEAMVPLHHRSRVALIIRRQDVVVALVVACDHSFPRTSLTGQNLINRVSDNWCCLKGWHNIVLMPLLFGSAV